MIDEPKPQRRLGQPTEQQKRRRREFHEERAKEELARMKQRAVANAFKELEPIFHHFGIAVKRRKGGWVGAEAAR